jgi:hypothetical protein
MHLVRRWVVLPVWVVRLCEWAEGAPTFWWVASSVWRVKRAGSGGSLLSIVLVVITLGVVVAGAWWTARAVVEGNAAGNLWRFICVSIVGAYYLTLLRFTRGRRITMPASLLSARGGRDG